MLLDAVTMLGLIDETGLESKLCEVRRGLLDAIRAGEESLCLADWYNIETLDEAADEYIAMITSARARIQVPDQLRQS